MYQISNAMYEDMATSLCEEINNSTYFSGVMELTHTTDQNEEVEIRIVASLIIYRSQQISPDCASEVISNIVPVWIECHTYVETEERINDFDIKELKNYICTC